MILGVALFFAGWLAGYATGRTKEQMKWLRFIHAFRRLTSDPVHDRTKQ